MITEMENRLEEEEERNQIVVNEKKKFQAWLPVQAEYLQVITCICITLFWHYGANLSVVLQPVLCSAGSEA